jgi:hypothetical protein
LLFELNQPVKALEPEVGKWLRTDVPNSFERIISIHHDKIRQKQNHRDNDKAGYAS